MATSIFSNTNTTLAITFVSIFFLLTNAQYIKQYCDDESGTYNILSKYESNINNSITKLTSLASNSSYNTFTSGNGTDKVNTLFYCRYDVSSSVCQNCIANTLNNVSSCPLNVEAIIFYQECTLYYSNRSIFGIMETAPWLSVYTVHSIDDNGVLNRTVATTVSLLISDVLSAFTSFSRYFAMRTAIYSSTHTIYALAQCNEDITALSCRTCLEIRYGIFAKNHSGAFVGQFFTPSCRLSYKLSDQVETPPWDFSKVVVNLPTLPTDDGETPPPSTPFDNFTPPPPSRFPPFSPRPFNNGNFSPPNNFPPPPGSGSSGKRGTLTWSLLIASIFTGIFFLRLLT